MATRLRFPRGTTHRFLLTWERDGAAIDLTGATLEAFIKRSIFDADDDALEVLGLTALDAPAGLAILTIDAARTADLGPFEPLYWVARATLPSGDVILNEAHHGPLHFSPLGLPATEPEPPQTGIEATLEPSGEISILPPEMANYVINRYDLTGLTGGASTDLDGITEAALEQLQNGARLVLTLTAADDEKIRLEYELGAKGASSESAPFVIVCDNDSTRCWRLDRGTVHKGGQPCAYNATSGKFHRIWSVGADGAAAPSMDPTGFTIPA